MQRTLPVWRGPFFSAREYQVTVTFEVLGLGPELAKAVDELGFESPTAIQEKSIPVLLAGHDMVGQAQTGTGKTAAFALPMLQNLDPEEGQVQGLVMTPTRELAMQIAAAIHDLGRYTDARVLPIYGGKSYSHQIRRLREGVEIVVGTPGRILDLLKKGVLSFAGVRFLVLDEADEMLSMGFIEDIEAILSETPDTRQTALFSATMPKEIRALADNYMHEPETITVDPGQVTVENIEQRYYVVPERDKLAAITRLLEAEDVTSALVFTKTRVGADQLADALTARGFTAEALHGELGQQARESVLRHFRQGQTQLLISTDVAARGLDIDDMSHVINFDIPVDIEYYVHRIGRTGRAGKQGVALTLVTPKEGWRLGRIEKYMHQTIPEVSLPSIADVQKRRDERFIDKLAEQLALDDFADERTLAENLVAGGYDPLDLAAAAIQLARAGEIKRPVEDIARMRTNTLERDRRDRSERRSPQRSAPRRRPTQTRTRNEPGMVRLSLNVGRESGIRPGEIVGAITGTAGIEGKAIGAIKIHDLDTSVDVAQDQVDHVIRRMKGWKIRGQAIKVELARE